MAAVSAGPQVAALLVAYFVGPGRAVPGAGGRGGARARRHAGAVASWADHRAHRWGARGHHGRRHPVRLAGDVLDRVRLPVAAGVTEPTASPDADGAGARLRHLGRPAAGRAGSSGRSRWGTSLALLGTLAGVAADPGAGDDAGRHDAAHRRSTAGRVVLHHRRADRGPRHRTGGPRARGHARWAAGDPDRPRRAAGQPRGAPRQPGVGQLLGQLVPALPARDAGAARPLPRRMRPTVCG